MSVKRSGIGAAIALAASGQAVAQARPAFNLITSNQIEINQPAATIWPKIVDPSSWKQGAKLVHRSGPAGERGEVLVAMGSDNAVAFAVENVEMVANRRRTIKLVSPAGQLIGYAIWTLVPAGSKTVVRYDVFSETVLTAEQAAGMSAAALVEQERASQETNSKRFDAELAALKKQLEDR